MQIQESGRPIVTKRCDGSAAAPDTSDVYTTAGRPVRNLCHDSETDSQNLLCTYTGKCACTGKCFLVSANTGELVLAA